TKDQVQFSMIQMGHRPGIVPMPTHGFLLFADVVFEGVGGPRSLSCDGLLIGGFVTLDLAVERSWRKWGNLLFLRALEILTVGTTFGFAGHGIVVGLKHLMNEFPGCEICLPFPSPVR